MATRFCSILFRVKLLNVLGLVVLVLPFSVLSQNIFSGPYSINDTLHGTARFEYYLDEGDTIRNGPFSFESMQFNEEDESLAIGTNYSGRYAENAKDGSWVFRHKKIRPTAKPEIQGFELVSRVTGEEYLVEAAFQEGRAHGNWRVIHHLITDGKSTDTLSQCRVEYANGLPIGKIKGKTGDTEFVGNYNKDGQPDGDWVISQTLKDGSILKEIRQYDNGIFKNHSFSLLNETFEITHVGLDYNESDDEQWEDVKLDADVLKIIQSTHFEIDSPGKVSLPNDLAGDGSTALIHQSNRILHDLLSAFSGPGQQDIWQPLGGSEELSKGKLRLRVFPMSDKEKELIAETVSMRDDALNIIEAFFKDPQVDINLHSTENMNFFGEVFWIYQKNLRELGQLTGLFAIPAAKYVDRETLFYHLKPTLKYPDTIVYDFQDEILSRPFNAPNVDDSVSAVDFLHGHTSQIQQEVVRIEEEVSEILRKYQKQSRISDQEERLVEKRDSIIRLFKNQFSREDYNSYHMDISDRVVNNTRSWFQQYAELSIEKKLNRIDDLLACFNEVINLYHQLSKVPIRLSNIQDLYTRTVWNPYTYTDMNERIKERLYRAYENVVLPAIWNDLLNNLECGEISNKGKNYERIYQRMMELREQDTKEIEKALRRPGSVSEVLSTISLPLDLDTEEE